MRLAIVLAGLLACATPPHAPEYALFEPLPGDDAFAPAIEHWQAESRLEALTAEVAELRAQMAGANPPPVTEPDGDSALGAAYGEFRSELRHGVVSETLRWVQQQSGLYYRRDPGADDWPVLGELLAAGADDCDGMDLLTFSLLRRMGFERGEIYRTIVRNVETDLHHIVTLWFEPGRSHDPWLLDSTGEITKRVIPLSAQTEWEPLRLFDETSAYTVRAR
jgi:hypothetical protein